MRMFAYMTYGNPNPNCTCGHRCHEKLVLDVPEVMTLLGLKSRRSVEALIKSGQLKSYMVLSLRKVDRQAVQDYLKNSVAPEYTANQAR